MILTLLFISLWPPTISAFSLSNCTEFIVGHDNEINEKAVLRFSDFNKTQEMVQWSQYSCVNVRLFSNDADLTDIEASLEVIPKIKGHVTIVSSGNSKDSLVEQFKCSGFAVDWVVQGGKVVSICPASVRNLHINVSYYCFFPICIPNLAIEDGTARFIIDELEARLGFVIDNRLLSQGFSQWVDDEGNVQGLVGEVSTGISELGFGQPGLDWNRFQLIDYTPVLDVHHLGFSSANPRNVSPLFTLARPFPWTVWIVMVIMVVLILITLSLQDSLFDVNPQRMFHNISLVITVMLSRTGPPEKTKFPHFSLGRIAIISTWLLVGTLLCMAYSSELLANLVKIDQTQPLDTVDQMLNSKLPVMVLNQSIIPTLVRTSPNPKIRLLFQKGVVENNGFVPNNMWDSPEMIQREQRGEIIAVGDLPGSVIKNTHFASEEISAVPNANIVRKGSGFSLPVAKVTQRLLAGGLIKKKETDLINEKLLEHKRKREQNLELWIPLRLDHLYGLLIAFASLLILAFCICGVELTCKRAKGGRL